MSNSDLFNPSPAKLRSIKGFRKKKGLCEKCGRFPSTDTSHTCLENWIKSDMRDEELPQEVYDYNNNKNIGIQITIESDKEREMREQAKLTTIKSYREKKDLCLRCGKIPTDACGDENCKECYDKSDMRTEEEKEKDPRTIITPQKKEVSLIDQLKTEELNKQYMSVSDEPFFEIKKTQDIVCMRPYIMIVRGQGSET